MIKKTKTNIFKMYLYMINKRKLSSTIKIVADSYLYSTSTIHRRRYKIRPIQTGICQKKNIHSNTNKQENQWETLWKREKCHLIKFIGFAYDLILSNLNCFQCIMIIT